MRPTLPTPGTMRSCAVRVAVAGALLGAGAFIPASVAQADTVPGAITGVDIAQSSVEQYASFRLDLSWQVPNSAKPGDTFSLRLPDQLVATEGTTFTLRNADDDVVADARVEGGVATFTVTDFVADHVDVKGNAWFYVQLQRNIRPGQTVHLEFDVDGRIFTDDITVTGTAPVDYSNTATKWMTWADPSANNPPLPSRDRLLWAIMAPRVSSGTAGGQVTFVDIPGPGSKIDCDTILGFWGSANTGAATQSGFMASDRYTTSCTPDRLELVLTTRSDDVGKIPFIQGWSYVSDATLKEYRNSARVLVDRGGSYTVSDVTRRGGGGVGDGVVPTQTATPTGPGTTTSAPTATSLPTQTATSVPTRTATPVPTQTATSVPTQTAPSVPTTSTPPVFTATTPPVSTGTTPPVASATTPPTQPTQPPDATTPPVASGTTAPTSDTPTAATPPLSAGTTVPVASGTTPPVARGTTPPVARGTTPPSASTPAPSSWASAPARIDTGEPASGARNGWLVAGGAALIGAAGIGLLSFGRGERGRDRS